MPGRVCKEIICSGRMAARNYVTHTDLLQTAVEAGMSQIPDDEMAKLEEKLAANFAELQKCDAALAEIAEHYAEKYLT